mgnify:FL=1
MDKIKTAVMVSGGGTNLQAIIDAVAAEKIKSASIEVVISSNASAYAVQRAQNAGIKTAVVEKKQCDGAEDFERRILGELTSRDIQLIVLAGFMSILSEKFIALYPGRIINVHPSLIPAFCGKGCYGIKVHEAALRRGVKVSGATVHFVNEIPDGGEIIEQKAVRVLPNDTPERLQQRVMRRAEWIILPRAVEQVAAKLLKQKENK